MVLKRRKTAGSESDALFDPTKVDVVSVSEDGSVVTVSISQVGPWSGSDVQLQSLQEKIHDGGHARLPIDGH